jgi:hypothetical protein
VARLRDGEGRRDGLEVSHFTDEDYVGVLAQDGLQRVLERLRVGEHLALIDETALVLVHELDGVLDRHDVLTALGIDLVDHGRERGGLAGAGGARDEDEALRTLRHLLDDRRQIQLAERPDLDGDDADGGGHRSALPVHVAAEAGQPLDAEGEVELVLFLELLLLPLVEHAVGQPLSVLGRQLLELGEGLQLAVLPDLWVGSGGDVEVGSPPLDHDGQEVVHRRGHGVLYVSPRADSPRGGVRAFSSR